MASLGKRSEDRCAAETVAPRSQQPPIEGVLEQKAMFGMSYCLVKWKGLPVHAATWEPLEEVQQACGSEALCPGTSSAPGPRRIAFSRAAEGTREVNSRKRRKRARKGMKPANLEIKRGSADTDHFENNDEESTSAAELHASQNENSNFAEPSHRAPRDVDVRLGLRLPGPRLGSDLLEYYRHFQIPLPLTATFHSQQSHSAAALCRAPAGPEAGDSRPSLQPNAQSPPKKSSSKKSADKLVDLSPKAMLSGAPQAPLEKPKRTISSFDSLFAYKPKYSLESLSAYSVQLLNLKYSALKGAPGSYFDIFQRGPDIFSKFEEKAADRPVAPVEDLTAENPQASKQPGRPKIRIEYKPLHKCESDRIRFSPIPNQPSASLFGQAQTCSSYPTLK